MVGGPWEEEVKAVSITFQVESDPTEEDAISISTTLRGAVEWCMLNGAAWTWSDPRGLCVEGLITRLVTTGRW